jgi:hypothetical protein
MWSSAFSKKPKKIFVPDHPIGRTCKVGISELNFGTKKFLHSANLQATIQVAGFLQVPPKSPFKRLLLGTGLWQYAKMSTSLKTPNGLKDVECEKGQLSHRPPIPYVPVIDVVTSKEEPQLYKDQASRRVTPQYPYLLPGEQQRIPCAHCCSLLHDQAKGAAQEVQGTRQGCCKTVQGAQESPRSHRVLRHRLNICGC